MEGSRYLTCTGRCRCRTVASPSFQGGQPPLPPHQGSRHYQQGYFFLFTLHYSTTLQELDKNMFPLKLALYLPGNPPPPRFPVRPLAPPRSTWGTAWPLLSDPSMKTFNKVNSHEKPGPPSFHPGWIGKRNKKISGWDDLVPSTSTLGSQNSRKAQKKAGEVKKYHYQPFRHPTAR